MACLFRGEPWSTWVYAIVLMLCYCVGELGHFLIGTLSRSIAQDIEFGNEACIPLSNLSSAVNSSAKAQCHRLNQSSCYYLKWENESLCEWNYDGSGIEYQVLAGPAFIAIFSVAGMVIGVLGDLYNRVRLLTVCVFFYSTMALLTGISTEYWHLIVFRMGFALGEAGVTPLSASIIADKFPSRSRALAMSLFNWGIYVGYGLAFCVGVYVTRYNLFGEGWRFSYYVTGVPGILMSIVLFCLLPEPQRKSINDKNDERKDAEDIEEIADGDKRGGRNALSKLLSSVKLIVSTPSLLLLLLAASVRHTASFCWAYNSKLYFEQYYPDAAVGWWMAFDSIVGGSVGIIVGGFVSDFVAATHGVSTRLWVLVISQGLASPLAALVVYLDPPYCFISLFVTYFFAEMWFGILFTVLVEFVPLPYRTTSLSLIIFLFNNVASTSQLAVSYLRRVLDTRAALLLTFPALIAISSILFLVTQLSMSASQRREDAAERRRMVEEASGSGAEEEVTGGEGDNFLKT